MREIRITGIANSPDYLASSDPITGFDSERTFTHVRIQAELAIVVVDDGIVA